MYGADALDHELEREAGACALDVAARGNSVWVLHQSPTLSSWRQLAQSPHPVVGAWFVYSAYNFYDFALKQKIRKKKKKVLFVWFRILRHFLVGL